MLLEFENSICPLLSNFLAFALFVETVILCPDLIKTLSLESGILPQTRVFVEFQLPELIQYIIPEHGVEHSPCSSL